jgi:hypothetical protein
MHYLYIKIICPQDFFCSEGLRSRLPRLSVLVVVVVDCLPHRQSEDHDEHENDQENLGPTFPTAYDSSSGLMWTRITSGSEA